MTLIPFDLAVGIMLYILIARMSSAGNISVIFSSLTVVLVPFIYSSVFAYISSPLVREFPFNNLISLSKILIIVLQLIAAYFVFAKLRDNDDTISAWLAWAAAGCVGIYFVIPSAVRAFFPGVV